MMEEVCEVSQGTMKQNLRYLSEAVAKCGVSGVEMAAMSEANALDEAANRQ